MNTLERLRQGDRRLLILQTLAQTPGYGVNEGVLCDYLDAMKHPVGRDLLRTELAWLAEQGFVTTETFEGVVVATLSARGLDVAEGRVVVPGVKRPGPEA